MWDRDGSGAVEQDELFLLIEYMRSHLPRPQEAAVPDITSNSSAWFEHFDEDGSGSLEKGELTRALIKTFHVSARR